MDYLHYRYKSWKPFEYLRLPEGQKRIARIYMRYEIRERNEMMDAIREAMGGN